MHDSALQLRRSDWSVAQAGAAARAFHHHLDTFGTWLQRAGAEPRFALVLGSGPRAREAMRLHLDMQGTEVVPVRATPDAPVDPRVANHQGDHFNRRLFVIDGLGADRGLFEQLQGRRSQLKRMATWVALWIDSLEALEALVEAAPQLWKAFGHRCLLLDPELRERALPLTPGRDWEGAVHEAVFAEAFSPRGAPDYHAFARLVRAGYAGNWIGAAIHPERQRMVQLWQGGEVRQDQLEAASAEAWFRHREGGTPLGALGETLAAVDAMGEGAPHDAEAIARLRAQCETPGQKAHAELAVAAACAAQDDLEGCLQALGAASESAQAAPELRFEALEKLVQLHTALHQRGPGRAALDRLELLGPTLASPFYAARVLLARGEFAAPLDAARARVDLELAEALFTRHGYPRWAEFCS